LLTSPSVLKRNDPCSKWGGSPPALKVVQVLALTTGKIRREQQDRQELQWKERRGAIPRTGKKQSNLGNRQLTQAEKKTTRQEFGGVKEATGRGRN